MEHIQPYLDYFAQHPGWAIAIVFLIAFGEALLIIGLFVPSTAVFGALALVPTMVGAVATQLFIVGASAIPPAVLLLGAVAVVWVRRHQIVRH